MIRFSRVEWCRISLPGKQRLIINTILLYSYTFISGLIGVNVAIVHVFTERYTTPKFSTPLAPPVESSNQRLHSVGLRGDVVQDFLDIIYIIVLQAHFLLVQEVHPVHLRGVDTMYFQDIAL